MSEIFDNPKNKHLRSVSVVGEGDAKVFNKTYHRFSEEEVYAIYDKYRYFQETLDSQVVRTPKVLSCDGVSIEFEYLSLPEERRLDTLLKNDDDSLQEAIQRVGKALALFHNACAGTEYIHGDFATANILIFSECVYFIDLEFPPTYLNHDREVEWFRAQIPYRTYTELDLGSFIGHSFIRKTSTLKMYWQVRTDLHHLFLDSYRLAGGKYDGKKLQECIAATVRTKYAQITRLGTYPWYKQGPHILMWTITILRNRYLRKAIFGF